MTVKPSARHGRPFAELVSLIDALPEPRILLGDDYRIVHANPAYRREFGAAGDVVGRTCYSVSHGIDMPCDLVGEACPLGETRRSGQVQRVLHTHHTPRGEEHVDVEMTPIVDGTGQTHHFVEALIAVSHARSQATPDGLVGRSPAFKQMLQLVLRAAPTDITILLNGETGTGKELVARAIHQASARAGGPFVAVDCAGMTETLFESEMFGHEKGAFTGADFRKTGLVEAAARGTLFLDEIGDMPLTQQVKLLRLLETGTYRRVGGVQTLPADFRLVCATHQDLERMVEAGTFRRDLYYRLSAFPVYTPALRERPDDIELLAESLLRRVALREDQRFSPAALQLLRERAYPGNVRELRNIVERASVLAAGRSIDPVHLSAPHASGVPPARPAGAGAPPSVTSLKDAERDYLQRVARDFGGSRAELARSLGISERTLFRKLSTK